MTMIDNDMLVKWRREFHRYPETGWAEFVTTAKLIQSLETMGHTVLTGRDMINPAFVRGRDPSIVEKAIHAICTLVVTMVIRR